MKIIVGSTSQRKTDVVKKIFSQYFREDLNLIGYPANSGVPDTPYAKQTYLGSKNRAVDCKNHNKKFDYCVGLESGLVKRYGRTYEEAWSCIVTKENREYFGYSSGLLVPEYILKRMAELDKEHCDVMTIIEEELGKLPNDTWGTYSGGAIARTVSLEEALRNALIQAIPNINSLYHL